MATVEKQAEQKWFLLLPVCCGEIIQANSLLEKYLRMCHNCILGSCSSGLLSVSLVAL